MSLKNNTPGVCLGQVSIAKWGEFQHYKHRDPPWIKLYRNTLTSEAWVCGTDDSRLVQVASILLAARYHNAIPMHPKVWNKVASLDLSPERLLKAIDHLVEFGFLQASDNNGEIVDASTMLAKGVQVALLETEAEAEAEEDYGSSIGKARVGDENPFGVVKGGKS